MAERLPFSTVEGFHWGELMINLLPLKEHLQVNRDVKSIEMKSSILLSSKNFHQQTGLPTESTKPNLGDTLARLGTIVKWYL